MQDAKEHAAGLCNDGLFNKKHMHLTVFFLYMNTLLKLVISLATHLQGHQRLGLAT